MPVTGAGAPDPDQPRAGRRASRNHPRLPRPAGLPARRRTRKQIGPQSDQRRLVGDHHVVRRVRGPFLRGVERGSKLARKAIKDGSWEIITSYAVFAAPRCRRPHRSRRRPRSLRPGRRPRPPRQPRRSGRSVAAGPTGPAVAPEVSAPAAGPARPASPAVLAAPAASLSVDLSIGLVEVTTPGRTGTSG